MSEFEAISKSERGNENFNTEQLPYHIEQLPYQLEHLPTTQAVCVMTLAEFGGFYVPGPSQGTIEE